MIRRPPRSTRRSSDLTARIRISCNVLWSRARASRRFMPAIISYVYLLMNILITVGRPSLLIWGIPSCVRQPSHSTCPAAFELERLPADRYLPTPRSWIACVNITSQDVQGFVGRYNVIASIGELIDYDTDGFSEAPGCTCGRASLLAGYKEVRYRTLVE